LYSPERKRIGPKIANPMQMKGASKRIEPIPTMLITSPITISLVPSPLARPCALPRRPHRRAAY
jgi:hypothetical protein